MKRSTTADALFQEMAEELECAMCLDVLREPRMLDCAHSFCNACLLRLAQEGDSHSIECPSCRETTALGREGVAGLKMNYVVSAIANTFVRLNARSKFCEECQVAVCSVKCTGCRVRLCQGCSDKIHALRIYSDHSIRPLELHDFADPISTDDETKAIPFCLVGGEVVGSITQQWFASLWFMPLTFSPPPLVFEWVFVPVWRHRCHTTGTATANLQVSGNHHIPISLEQSHTHAPLLYPAVQLVEQNALEFLAPWNLEEAIPKHAIETPKRTLEGTVALADSLVEAKKELSEQFFKLCKAQLSQRYTASKVRDVHVDEAQDVESDLILVPMITTSYSHRGKHYTLYINGQTGKVWGQRPYSKSKLVSMGIGSLLALYSLAQTN